MMIGVICTGLFFALNALSNSYWETAKAHRGYPAYWRKLLSLSCTALGIWAAIVALHICYWRNGAFFNFSAETMEECLWYARGYGIAVLAITAVWAVVKFCKAGKEAA